MKSQKGGAFAGAVGTRGRRKRRQESMQSPRSCLIGAPAQADGEGFEPTANSQGNSYVSPEGEAKAEAVSPTSSDADAGLGRIIAAWPTLPEGFRAAILALAAESL